MPIIATLVVEVQFQDEEEYLAWREKFDVQDEVVKVTEENIEECE